MSSHSRLWNPSPRVEVVERDCFTPDRANRALVLVERIVRDVRFEYQRVLDGQELLQLCQDRTDGPQVEQAKRELCGAMERLQACADELAEIGVDLRDWSAGVVDFPSRLDGREVHLCWRHGEPRVAHWHDPYTECACRQPLAESPVA